MPKKSSHHHPHNHEKDDAHLYDKRNLISIQHDLQVGKWITIFKVFIAIILAILVVFFFCIFGGVETHPISGMME